MAKWLACLFALLDNSAVGFMSGLALPGRIFHLPKVVCYTGWLVCRVWPGCGAHANALSLGNAVFHSRAICATFTARVPDFNAPRQFGCPCFMATATYLAACADYQMHLCSVVAGSTPG